MIVERTDFISVPVTDMERSKQFYGETLGLELVVHGEDQGFPEYQLGENVSLYLLDMKNIGSEFTAPHTASIALRVPDVEEARRELEEKGSPSLATPSTRPSATWRSSATRTGTR